MENVGEKIIKINIEEEMKSSYIDYSMSVIVSRALPDVRDGLKPVQRRVLYGMSELGVTSGNHSKSQRELSERYSESTTLMVIARFTWRWYVWLKVGLYVIRWLTDKETSVPWMEIAPRQCVILRLV